MLKLKSRILTISLLLLFGVMGLAACGSDSAGGQLDTGSVSSESKNSVTAKDIDTTKNVAVVKKSDAERKRVALPGVGGDDNQAPVINTSSMRETGAGTELSDWESLVTGG